MKGLSNLKELHISDAVIPEEIILALEGLPVVQLKLQRVYLTSATIHALGKFIETCQTLQTLDIFAQPLENAGVTDRTPIFAAVAKSKSIRHCSFHFVHSLITTSEFEILLESNRSSQTLRTLSLKLSVEGDEKVDVLPFEALCNNVCLESFEIYLCSGEGDSLPAKNSEAWAAVSVALEETFLKLLRENNVLRTIYCNSWIGIADMLCVDRLQDAFEKNMVLESIYRRKSPYQDALLEKKQKGDSLSVLQDQAANIVLIGRLFAGAKRICGKFLPAEIIEQILRQVTLQSPWRDDKWRVIRRVVMNRGTIGKLCTGRSEFDAYELLYRCRNLYQVANV